MFKFFWSVYATGHRVRNTGTHMTATIFIDGHNGSTGLRIHELLGQRGDLRITTLSDELRKDADARRSALVASDLAVLCLPDAAARQAVEWAAAAETRVIDASSAHRVSPGWVYGLPELPAQRERIRSAKFVANPGCYPTSVILLLRPLVEAGHVVSSAPITIHALSGYSGGGRSLIERWESSESGLSDLPFEAPYALDQVHKHIPEMKEYARLDMDPQFVPAVAPFPCGMRVQIPLHRSQCHGTPREIWNTIAKAYDGEPFVNVLSFEDFDNHVERNEFTFDPRQCNGTNRVQLRVLPNPAGHVLLLGILDNLGKGACGAAVQNLNLMLGLDEAVGLTG